MQTAPFKLTPDMQRELEEELGTVASSAPIQPRPEPELMKPDLVNHPPHYTAHPSGVECITITEWMNFNLGNAMKYIWRAAEKGTQIRDLEKARWYIERELDRLTRT